MILRQRDIFLREPGLYAGHMVEWGESDRYSKSKTSLHQTPPDSVPDPNRKQRKKISPRKAEAPQWTPDSKGCPFAERCDQVVSTCRENFLLLSKRRINNLSDALL